MGKARVTDVTLDKRTKLISEWNSDPEFDFDNPCLFIDEVVFNLIYVAILVDLREEPLLEL